MLNDENKQKAVVDLVTRHSSAKFVANKYNVNRVTLYEWRKELTGEPIIKKKEKTKQELETEIIELQKEHLKLKLENNVLKKANDFLKNRNHNYHICSSVSYYPSVIIILNNGN